MQVSQRNTGKRGGQSSRQSKGRGWFGDPEGHAKAGHQSSGNRRRNRGSRRK